MQRYHTFICKPGPHMEDYRSRAGPLSGNGILVIFFDHARVFLHDGSLNPGGPASELADLCSTIIIEEGYPWS